MSALERIAFFQNRRDEVPNQELARDLAESEDRKGIAEIVENLRNKNSSIRSDCIKVLYEIGYVKPKLISGYVNDFLTLLGSGNNRMVWGAMIALATISGQKSRAIWSEIDAVISATEKGSLITFVWGIKTLAQVAGAKKEYGERLLPRLMTYLKTCNPRDLPTHLESMMPAMRRANKTAFLEIVSSRKKDMKTSHLARLGKVLKKIEAV